MRRKRSKIILGIAIALVIATVLFAYFLLNFKIGEKEIDSENPDLKSKFIFLSKANTNFCAGPDILNKVNADRLQGSCCSTMEFHRYVEQVEGLKELRQKYPEVASIIPSDPYDVEVSLVEELLNYRDIIRLSAQQQEIYNQATKLSHEGGPCCCKCWRWYAFEGQAKYFIKKHNFNSEQIAEIWDLEDGCGGHGHAGHEEEVTRKVFEPQN